MTTLHRDTIFAPLDRDLHMARIGGGNETEVYTTDDHRYVIKVKSEQSADLNGAIHLAIGARRAARKFARIVGKQHSIPSYYVISRGDDGEVKPVVLQPFLADAVPLFAVDYSRLNFQQRLRIAKQLLHLIYRSVTAFVHGGVMPDLYGRASESVEVRKVQKSWRRLPHRLWGFIVKRNLLRAHNLMLINPTKPRIVLVDYDAVPHSKLYQMVYYSVRLMLFWRDLVLIWMMLLTGLVW